MTTSVLLFATILAVTGTSRFPAAPGAWKFTTTFAMGGLPVTPPPQIAEHCLRDGEDPAAFLAELGAPADCSVDGWTASGKMVRWTASCQGKYRGAGAGRLEFDGDRGEGEFTIRIEDGRGEEHPVRYRIEGMRRGACS
jgi:hypothetical protein